jgi:hypothetical protein
MKIKGVRSRFLYIGIYGEVFSRVVTEAGGSDAIIIVIPTASQIPVSK